MDKNEIFELVSKYRKAIMGFAALCIMIFHEWIVVFPMYPILNIIEAYVKRITFFGVDIFFFLSGMGLVFAINKGNLATYYWNRLKRIIVPPTVLLLILLFVDKWPLKDGLLSFCGFYFYTRSIYVFIWFFTAIVTVYLLFPLYYALFERAKNKIIFTTEVLIVWLILSIAFSGVMREDLYGFTNRIPIILLGVLFGWSKDHVKNRITGSHVMLLCFILILGLYFAWKTSMQGMYLVVPVSNCCIPNILITISLVPLLAILMEKRLFKGYLIKVLEFFGTFTFELYCLQEWMGSRFLPDIQARISRPILVNLVNFAMIILAAFILHKLIEVFFKLVESLRNYLGFLKLKKNAQEIE